MVYEKIQEKSPRQKHIEKCEFWRWTKEGICPIYPQPQKQDDK